MKFLTGFCGLGQCEGTKFKSPAGTPYPTCPWWDTCPCKCHADLDEMYEMAGIERVLVRSDYVPDLGSFVPIDVIIDEVNATRFNSVGTIAPHSHEGTVATPAVVVAGHAFADTPTGRKARGRLEYEVLEVCLAWDMGVYDWDACTPKNISEELATRNQSIPPSTGAISAVWERWASIGFCETAKKPLRMVRSEFKFSAQELDKLKSSARKKSAMFKSAQKRGIKV